MNPIILLGHGGAWAALAVPWIDKAAFMGVFGLLILLLAFLPAHLMGQAAGRPPWWRNIRWWAIFIALVQLLVYAWWG